MNTIPSTPRRLTGTLIAVAAAAALAACGSNSVSNAGGSDAGGSASGSATTSTAPAKVSIVNASNKGGPVLRVGDQAGTGSQALLQAAGLLDKLPFKVQFADFTSGPPLLQALGSGSLDVGGVGNAPPVFAAAGGAKITVVGALSNNPKSGALLVPKGSKIGSIADLKGKKIALVQGSAADYHLIWALKKAGLSPRDVTLDYLQPAQALAAFSSGAIDAWDVWSPFLEQAIVQKHAKVISYYNGEPANYSYVVANSSSIRDAAKAKEITTFLRTLARAHRWANRHPAAWGKTWSAATGLPSGITNQAAEDATQNPVPVDGRTTAAEQSVVDTFSQAGLIPRHYSFAPFTSTAFNGAIH